MLDRLFDRVFTILQNIAGALILTLFALNIVQITMRYTTGASWIWLPDLSRFLFIWFVFVGASVLVGRNEHLVMDFFIGKFPPAMLRFAQIVIQLGQIAFFGIMLIWGLRIFRVRLDVPFDTWDFPSGWAYLAVPVTALLMIVFSLNALWAILTNKGAKVE
jgi:TRAP-type C4-dicarboxylate transport system permease small subunit